MSEFAAALSSIKAQVAEGAPGVPVYTMLDPGSLNPEKVPVYLSVVFLAKDDTAQEEDEATGYVEDLWSWYVYLVVNGTNRKPEDVASQAAALGEAIAGALRGHEVDAFADGVRVGRFEFAGFTSGGQVFRLALSYHRTGG